MQTLTILNTREIKKIKESLKQLYGGCLSGDYVYLKNSKSRIFIINKDVAKIELKNLKIDKMGLYFAEIMDNGDIRLSKEGAQLLGSEAKVETVELSKDEVKKYFKGDDLEKKLGENSFVLLSYLGDILGCAKYKEGKILNFLPKMHRGEVIL